MPKPLTVWITRICGKFWKRWEYQTTWPASWEACMQVRKQQLELDMEQQTLQIGKGVCQGCILLPCLFNLYAEYKWEMLGWKKHKLESRLLGEIVINSDMQMIPPYGRKWRKTKEPLDESERGEWKSWLKPNIQKTKIMASSPITSWQIHGETVESVTEFIIGGLQNHCRWWLQITKHQGWMSSIFLIS